MHWAGPATDHTVEVLHELGIDARAHRSRPLSRRLVKRADLVLAMTRNHVWAVVNHDPTAADRTFMIGEIVRLGGRIGPRGADEPLARLGRPGRGGPAARHRRRHRHRRDRRPGQRAGRRLPGDRRPPRHAARDPRPAARALTGRPGLLRHRRPGDGLDRRWNAFSFSGRVTAMEIADGDRRKVAVVTGGGSGIGRATALAFAGAGADGARRRRRRGRRLRDRRPRGGRRRPGPCSSAPTCRRPDRSKPCSRPPSASWAASTSCTTTPVW